MRGQGPWGLVLGALVLVVTPARAREMPKEHRPAVDKGLAWLAKQQHRDGHWEATSAGYATPMTALAGLALLMEGSTLREGKYRPQLQKATDWLLARSRPNGLIASAPEATGRYIFGHGYAMLFLACAAGDLEDGPQKRRILDVLERAAGFSAKAQTSRGGWGYVAADE